MPRFDLGQRRQTALRGQPHRDFHPQSRPQQRLVGGDRRIQRPAGFNANNHLIPALAALDQTDVFAAKLDVVFGQDRTNASGIDVDAAQFDHVVGPAQKAHQTLEGQPKGRRIGPEGRNIMRVEADDRKHIIFKQAGADDIAAVAHRDRLARGDIQKLDELRILLNIHPCMVWPFARNGPGVADAVPIKHFRPAPGIRHGRMAFGTDMPDDCADLQIDAGH